MKRIAITMGEPGGIGPEVALRAAASSGGICGPVLVGDAGVFADALRILDLPVTLREVASPEVNVPGELQVVHAGSAGNYRAGGPSADGGKASVAAVMRAFEMARSGEAYAMVTAPISKEALRMAGYRWPGHTEMLAELSGTDDYAMVLVGGGLRVLLVTIHTALKDVPPLITKDSVLKGIRLAGRAAWMLGLGAPRIAVAGLNPHAGEAGMFGPEEAGAIVPACQEAEAGGIAVTGPYAPDTVFFRALRGEFDLVVAMYHDQGLIPLKLHAFDTGVNITVGLPVIRTSPDHGTAYDIAWQGRANPRSMQEAVRTALELRL